MKDTDSAFERIVEWSTRAGLRPSKGAAIGAVSLVLVIALIGVVRWTQGSAASGEGVVFEAADPAHTPSGSESTSSQTTETVFVHIVGAVRHPGVYELPVGSRVNEAMTAAGGALSSASSEALNLARQVTDGEQLRVPTEEEWEAALAESPSTIGATGSGSGGSGVVGEAGLVDLNTADIAALETLPGVGPATAAKIVADREANGPFKSADDLMRVAGLGPKKVEALRGLVSPR